MFKFERNTIRSFLTGRCARAGLRRRIAARRACACAGARACPTSPIWSTGRAGGGQHPHHREGRRRAAGNGEMDEEMQEFFRRFFGQPMPGIPRQGPRPNRPQQPRTKSAAARRGLRLHPQRRRLRHDQCARRRRRRRGDRHARRQARVQGQDRSAPTSAPTSRSSRSRPPACRRCKIGDVSKLQGRRMGDGDRLAVRPREHRDRRHRQRQAARHRRLPAVHPDRRRHQPRQLRRPADQHARRGGRHQLPDLLALGRLHGHLVRDPDRRGDPRQRAAAHQRPRLRGRIGVQIDQVTQGRGRIDRPRASRRARWCAASRPARRPRRPASSRATSSPSSTARPSTSPATCRASWATPSPAPRARCRCSAAAARAT